jgi:hypothetical protein
VNDELAPAEQALTLGLLDRAEALFREAADADPLSSVAVLGLGRVALERGDDAGALRLAWRAVTINPENAAAQRLAARLEEVLTTRGEALPVREVNR